MIEFYPANIPPNFSLRQGFLMLLRAIVLVLVGLTSSLFASTDSSIQQTKLDNGLEVLVVENHQSPVVYSSIWYRVGGSDEPNGLTGISHMLEHMMFKGTESYPDGIFKKSIAERGGKQNAMTSRDFTAYYQMIPSSALDYVMHLEADRMQQLAPTQSAFDKEHAVVMEERRMRIDDNPQGKTWLHFNATASINGPYHQPVIGWLPDIQQYQLNDVMRWYHQWYGPNNAVIIVIGDVTAAQVFKTVKHYFGDIPAIELPVRKNKMEVASFGPRQVNLKLPAQLPWLVLGYNVPSLSQLSQQDQWQAYALYLAAEILSQQKSGRIAEQLIRKQRLVSSGSVWYDLFSRFQSLWVIQVTPEQSKSIAAVKDGLIAQVHLLQTQPVSSKVLERVKKQIIAAHTFSKDSIENQAKELGSAKMSGVALNLIAEFDQHIAAVTPSQIQQVAQRYLTMQQLTIGELEPQSVPSKQTVKSSL